MAVEASYFFPSLVFLAYENENHDAINCIVLMADTNLLNSISNTPDTLRVILKEYNKISAEPWNVEFFKNLMIKILDNKNSIISRELS